MDKKRLLHAIEWVVALAACGYLVYRLVVFDDYASLAASLQGMGWHEWSALALCIVLMPVNMALEAWRWMTMWDDGKMPFREAHRQVYYSKLAGLITPWKLGEYPARALLMSNEQNSMTNSELWSRVLSKGVVGSATMTSAIVIVGIAAIGMSELEFSDTYLMTLAAVVLLLGVTLYLAPRLLQRWTHVSRRLIAVSIGQSMVRLLCWCVQLYLVLFALGVFDLSISRTMELLKIPVYYLLVTITPNVPVAEAGVRGAWAIGLFGSVNAALAGVLLWVVNTLLPCLVWPLMVKNKQE